MSRIVKKVVAAATLSAATLLPYQAFAQSAAVVCPGYEKGKTQIVGERVGRKVQTAFEAYNNDQIAESVEILKDINPKGGYDKAFVDRFLGNILASMDGRGEEAFNYLTSAVSENLLNDTDQASTLRLLGDLSMQEKKYTEAIKWYDQWMTYTCKSDPDVYTRITQAYYETGQLDKMVEPADKAIALYEEPNKNPYVLKLTSYYERKMYPQTVDVAETLVKLFPDNKQWWTQLGFFYMLVEDFAKALSTFEISYNNGYLTKESEIKALAQLYATMEIPHKSAMIQEKYMKEGLIKRDEASLAALANTLHQARDHKKAAMYYGEAAKVSSDPEHYRKQGVLLLAAEDYDGAQEALKKALERGVEDEGRVHIALMEAYFYDGDFRNAYVHVREARKDRSTRQSANAWEPYIKEKAKNRGITI
ncbi:hypothetical protein [Aestuariibacter salexigens]|uniref:hypothetical protein n=1 Tax=Aestuariibacter salexigens TaxID=226010 RepID=UPI0003FCB7F6|nr:hypothetical protein [Aestuariibacter salexigens]